MNEIDFENMEISINYDELLDEINGNKIEEIIINDKKC
jgi:hypothetical protein